MSRPLLPRGRVRSPPSFSLLKVYTSRSAGVPCTSLSGVYGHFTRFPGLGTRCEASRVHHVTGLNPRLGDCEALECLLSSLRSPPRWAIVRSMVKAH